LLFGSQEIMETSELSKQAPIVLLTDFGNSDYFVGVLKGVCASLSPGFPVIDITHDILLVTSAVQRSHYGRQNLIFQPGRYFVALSIRELVLLAGDDRPIGGLTFVGPDNGIFTFVLGEDFQAWELLNPDLRLQNIGSTFHGRDIFAPAAAYAARGIPSSQFGPPIEYPYRIPEPRLILSAMGSTVGEILFDDRFGNLLTSIGRFQHLVEDRFRFVPWLEQQPVLENSEFKLSSYILQLPSGVEARRCIRTLKLHGLLRHTLSEVAVY
jgi:S-adenosylmethionine hydrolase